MGARLLTAEVCRHGDLAGIVYGYLQQRYVGMVIWQDSVWLLTAEVCRQGDLAG